MKYTEEKMRDAVTRSKSVTDVMRIFGVKMTGGSHSHITKTIKKFNIDTSHFVGSAWNKGRKFPAKRTAEETFNLTTDYRPKSKELTRALIQVGRIYECEVCKNDGTWAGQKLTLHVDHINGDWQNNKELNLRFLCPNCHSQTSTFGSKNVRVVKR